MFNSLEDMMTGGNFKRINQAQKDSYIAHYRPIYEQLQQSKLTGEQLELAYFMNTIHTRSIQ